MKLTGFPLSALVALAFTPLLHGGENVLLTTGFSLYAERHESVGEMVKLYLDAGEVEMPAASIAGYEPFEKTKPFLPPAPSQAFVPEPLPAPVPVRTPADLALAAAEKFRLPDAFVRSVMKAESGFRPDAVSPKGAIGLMQLMPETARQLGVNPRDPGQNAEGGAQYLRELLAKYENQPDQVLLALAAYNAGPQAVEKYHGVPPYPETREYILRVLRNWQSAEKK